MLCCNQFILATSFNWTEQQRSLKNEERKREKVIECSRRKAQNDQAKNLHKKDQHNCNNCYEILSRAIKNVQIKKTVKKDISLR